MERETGLEPATLSLEGWCSSQLSYSRNGGESWIRTTEGESQQIYSLPSLATWVTHPAPYISGQTLIEKQWSWLRDLNSLPSAYKADALPTELNQHLSLQFVKQK